MDKVNITKDGVTQLIKHRYLQNFLDQGWSVEGESKPKSKKKSAVDYTIEATADVIEEATPPIVEEEESSMPITNQGEE